MFHPVIKKSSKALHRVNLCSGNYGTFREWTTSEPSSSKQKR